MKELEECQQLQIKIYDKDAIHRNEVTGEIETSIQQEEYLDDLHLFKIEAKDFKIKKHKKENMNPLESIS